MKRTIRREIRKHEKHLDECGWCCESVGTRISLDELTEKLERLYGSEPFVLNTEILRCIGDFDKVELLLLTEIPKLNGGAL
jgi:hypothetical protein